RIWLNGEPIWSAEGGELDYASVTPDVELAPLFRDGVNVLAVHASAPAGGRVLDLGLRDARPLATVKGDPTRPSARERYSARLMLPRPGEVSIQARVRVAAPPGAQKAAENVD